MKTHEKQISFKLTALFTFSGRKTEGPIQMPRIYQKKNLITPISSDFPERHIYLHKIFGMFIALHKYIKVFLILLTKLSQTICKKKIIPPPQSVSDEFPNFRIEIEINGYHAHKCNVNIYFIASKIP